MSSIHELLKQVYPLKLRMELFNAIWTGMSKEKQCECWDLYLSLKQFYSRLGVEAYADDEIQDVAVKELNRLLNENEQLKQQLDEKDKEIEMLKHTLNLYNLRHKGSVLPNVNQLAIQELEKVKDYICDCTYIKEPDYTNVRRKIDNQIKELKGETK